MEAFGSIWKQLEAIWKQLEAIWKHLEADCFRLKRFGSIWKFYCFRWFVFSVWKRCKIAKTVSFQMLSYSENSAK